jgi:hypothetical protein
MIKAELLKSRARSTGGSGTSAAELASPIQNPWPIDPSDDSARSALARRWLELQRLDPGS